MKWLVDYTVFSSSCLSSAIGVCSWMIPVTLSSYCRAGRKGRSKTLRPFPMTKMTTKKKPSTTLFTKTLEAFTMAREPFERLVSFFHYDGKFTKTNRSLKPTVFVALSRVLWMTFSCRTTTSRTETAKSKSHGHEQPSRQGKGLVCRRL